MRHARYDYHYLDRFLRGMQYDITGAQELFTKHLNWRRENQVDFIHLSFSFDEAYNVFKHYKFG